MNWKKLSAVLLTAGTLTACGMQNDNVGQDGMNNNVQPVRNRSHQQLLEDRARDGYGYTDEQTYDGTYPQQIRDGATNYDGTGTGTGLNQGMGTTDRDFDHQGRSGSGMNGTGTHMNDRADTADRYDVAEEAADRITSEVDSIDRAYVLTTGRNAYVAAELNEGNTGRNGELSNDIEREVEEAVKSELNDIENVYVSTNPDFVNLSTNYMDDVNRGEPIEGFFDQMGEMIQRVFPGTNNTNPRNTMTR